MNNAPKIPAHISVNGQEVWDWAEQMAAFVSLKEKRREIKERIGSIESKCGSCTHWMTTDCPREKPRGLTGFNTGPSMNSSSCQKFHMQDSTKDLLQKLKNELAEPPQAKEKKE